MGSLQRIDNVIFILAFFVFLMFPNVMRFGSGLLGNSIG